jgi:LysM repeat protein
MARRNSYNDLFTKILITALLLIGIWSVYDNVQASSSTHTPDSSYKIVYVAHGDSLWSIAAKNIGDKQDIRTLIVAIKNANGLSKDVEIYPGQALKIPTR